MLLLNQFVENADDAGPVDVAAGRVGGQRFELVAEIFQEFRNLFVPGRRLVGFLNRVGDATLQIRPAVRVRTVRAFQVAVDVQPPGDAFLADLDEQRNLVVLLPVVTRCFGGREKHRLGFGG